jgi:uncharacterized protein (TIGR02266 family)
MQEKRKFERIAKKLKSEVLSDQGFTFSKIVDISKGGLFISTPEPLREGSHINLSLQIPSGEAIELKGIVKWIRQDEIPGERAGMGIEFIDAANKAFDTVKNIE